jgi:hypothetical protein
MALLVKNSVCDAADGVDAVSGQIAVWGGCKPGKINTAANHCNPLGSNYS